MSRTDFFGRFSQVLWSRRFRLRFWVKRNFSPPIDPSSDNPSTRQRAFLFTIQRLVQKHLHTGLDYLFPSTQARQGDYRLFFDELGENAILITKIKNRNRAYR